MASRFRSPAAATALGVLAPICWGMSISLMRGISEGFGRSLGLMLLYACSAAALFFLVGLPDFRKMKPVFRFLGIGTANLCSLCFCFAIFTAETPEQTLEAGMVNYLWPSLTILFAVMFTGVKARAWLYPGLVIAFSGIVIILAGDGGFSLSGFWERACENPACYMLALGAAVTWSAYSAMTRLWAGGENPSTIVFAIDTLIFAAIWILDLDPAGSGASFSVHGMASLAIGAVVMGGAYAAWTHGFEYGHPAVLATASYFTPVLSCLFGLAWLGAEPSLNFWKGVCVVVAGSLICASATSSRFNRPRHARGVPLVLEE